MNYVEELLAEALITAPQCPETIVERMLRTSCVDFYRETKAWRLTTDPLAVIKGIQQVDLDVPKGTLPIYIYWARLDDKDLNAISPRAVRAVEGVPTGFAFTDSRVTIDMSHIPTQTYTRNGLKVHLAVAPTNSLDDIPDELFAMHRDGILYGAQQRLLAMPNVVWGDLNTAVAMATMSQGEKIKARREAESVQSNVVRKVRYGGI